jgi:hypothetical protein
MVNNLKNSTQFEDRIRLPFNFDVNKMLEEVETLRLNQYNYYKAFPLRAPAHLIDPSLPFPPPSDDYADGSWTDWLDTPQLKECPYLLSVINTFRKHTKVTLVRLLYLAPQSVVDEHTDPTLGLEIEKSVIRLTIPIYSNDEVIFYLNEIPVEMQAGECWYLRLTDRHKVTNFGTTDRINLTIDMIPNDWVRKTIEESRLSK